MEAGVLMDFKLPVDIYSCNGCGRAIVIERNEEMEICPYQDCGSDDLEFSHSGYVMNEEEEKA
jgi:RNA polymerase subunit RPABC4/transcription elongation factor Spt4